MSRSIPIPSISWLSNRQLSMVEVESLIDMMPGAAVLIDIKRNRVALANAAMAELTAFTRNELTNQELGNLLPTTKQKNLNPKHLSGLDVFTDQLLTRQGSHMEVRVSYHHINPGGSWGLAIIEPLVIYENKLADHNRQRERLADLVALVRSLFDSEPRQSIQYALEAGHRLAGARHLAVYLVQASEPELKRYISFGAAEQLPDVITPDEAWKIANPQVWVPGKRANNELHRAARKLGFSYLASRRLGEDPAFIGLLVIADTECSLPEDFELLLEILALVITGIIQQKTFQEQLISAERNSRRKLLISETFIESSQEGLLMLTPDLMIEGLNPAAETLLGYASREVSGLPIGNVLIGPANLIPALQSAQEGRPTANLGEVRLVRRDGGNFLAHISALPFILGNRVEGIIVIFRDLSENEQYAVRNQQLEQRALLGEVTAIFAHEVRNPINNLVTGLQLMALNLPEDHPNQEVIARLTHDCNRLTHLMQSVLTFSKPAENKLQVVNLNELLPAVLERWRPRLARFNINHEIHKYTERATIMGDARALEQVFNNLISNAIEAMRDTAGKVSVTTRSAPEIAGREYVEVNVIDNGPGIPEDMLERIFDPFVTNTPHGTGLGLSIAKRIVNKHKGTINTASVPGGTVFRTVFPVCDPDEAEQIQ